MATTQIVATNHSTPATPALVKVEPEDGGYGVDLDLDLGGDEGLSVTLTPDEARAVAAALVHHADERDQWRRA